MDIMLRCARIIIARHFSAMIKGDTGGYVGQTVAYTWMNAILNVTEVTVSNRILFQVYNI